jgi:hypothetical protein
MLITVGANTPTNRAFRKLYEVSRAGCVKGREY